MTTDLPDVVRVTAAGTFDGEPWNNVFHMQWTGAGSPGIGDLQALLNLLGAATTLPQSWGSMIRPMDLNVSFTSLTARTLDLTTPYEATKSIALTGNRAGNNLPPMLCALVKWNGVFAVRTSRGRSYLVGVNDNMIDATDGDRLSAAAIADLVAAAQAFITYWQVTNGDWQYVVLSRTKRDDDVVAPYDTISTFEVEPRIAIQRRRWQPAS